MNIDEKTEITVPLKVLISIISAIVIAAWYAFTTQAKIVTLENQINLQKIAFEEYRKQPSRGQLEVALVKKDIENLKINIAVLEAERKKK
jgi:type II secretory pathway pseudopilin PulG